MDDDLRLENQRTVAAAFFRNLAAEDASGLDLALAGDLVEALANAGLPPALIQYSCAFEGTERAAGRFVFGWRPEQLTTGGGPVDAAASYRSLASICEFPRPDGIDAVAEQLGAPPVRCVWLGFDARVLPERSRTRIALSVAPGASGGHTVAALFAALGLPPGAADATHAVAEVALEHGPDGPADLRLSWPVRPDAVARNPALAADPVAVALLAGARQVRIVRPARPGQRARLVFLYGPGDAAEAQLTAYGRRSALAAELRRALRRANRALPAGAGMTVRPWGATLAIENGRPRGDHVAFLLRPHASDAA